MSKRDEGMVRRGHELLEKTTIDRDVLIRYAMAADALGAFDEHPDRWVREIGTIRVPKEIGSNISSVEYVGDEEALDLEVEHPDHQFYMDGTLTSNSHAVSYAIDSYYCAYLLTHYPEEWLVAYLEAMSSNPDDRSRAIGEVRGLGYTISSLDVNLASKEWVALPGKQFMPSLLSCKGVGEAAIDEIMELRGAHGFRDIHHMLYGDDGRGVWQLSKFNKRALEALIKVEAFGSLGCVGEGRLFSSYRHMHHVLIERNAELKKTTKKDPMKGMNSLRLIADETRETHGAEWSRREQVENMVEVVGAVDVARLIDDDTLSRLGAAGVCPIDALEEGDKGNVWFVSQSHALKRTKNGKQYCQIEALGPSGKVRRLNVWGWKPTNAVQPYTLYLAKDAERNDFGVSCTSWNVREVG